MSGKYIFLVTLLSLVVWEFGAAEEKAKSTGERIILIDADAGLDDSWAFLMAAAAHKSRSKSGFNIIGVTSVCGNADAYNVTVNAARSLQTANESDIPIYKGSEEYLMQPFSFFEEPPFFGEDGFGDADLPSITPKIEEEHAVNAIIRLAHEYKDKLTIVALGPLTNLAMAVKISPQIKDYVKEVFILGGNMDAVGNAAVAAEFNFLVDPEAAAITLASYRNITLMPIETFEKAKIPMEFRLKTLGELQTPQMELQNAIEKTHFEQYPGPWNPADAALMSCAIDQSIMKETKSFFAQMELQGSRTRGMLVVDKANLMKKPPNVRIIMEVDQKRYEEFLVWAAGGKVPDSYQE